MEVKKGYKKTEIGVIPEEWNVKKLNEVAHFSNGKGHEQYIDDSGEYVVVNSKFISTEGNVRKHSRQNLSPLLKNEIALVMSDIPNGKALAKCYIIEKNNTYTLNQRIGCIRPKDGDSKYYYYQLNRNEYFLSFDTGTGQTNLRRNEILDCPILIPNNHSEQTAIATALSDTDALISSLEKLIAKKRNIKQGAMQQLLQPKEGWVVKSLGNLTLSISSGKSNTEFKEGKYPIYGSTGIIGWSNNYDYQGEKILIARVGANAGTVNKVSGLYCVSDNTLIISLDKGVDIDFVYFRLIYLNLNNLVFGSGQPLITGGQLNILSFPMPKKNEQETISKIISDIDAEIKALEAKLEKYRQIKQGMMQQLLTGKIRLV